MPQSKPEMGPQFEPDPHFQNFEILSPEAFFEDFQYHSVRATQRVYAQTMYVEAGLAFDAITDSLLAARQRGVNATELHVDAYSLLVEADHISWMELPTSEARARQAAREAKKATLEKLEGEGVAVTITNTPNLISKTLPFVGRNHIKLAVADSVAWVGGLSFCNAVFEKEDFMMRITDPEIVEPLSTVFESFSENNAPGDMTIECNADTTIMVDGGKRGESIIFDEALRLLDKAEASARFITQYSANGIMARKLRALQTRGGDVVTVVSSNESISEWFGRLLDRANMLHVAALGRQTPTLYSDKRVHAKGLLLDEDYPDRAVGGIGSHNLTHTGVKMGTQELFVFSKAEEFVRSLANYLDRVQARVIDQRTQQ